MASDDLETTSGLRMALAEIAADHGAQLGPPATQAEIESAEARLGFRFPPILRRIYAIANGWRSLPPLLLALGEGSSDRVNTGDAGILDIAAFYREQMEAYGGCDDGEWIGWNHVPVVDLYDGDYLVLHRSKPGLFKWWHDQGISDEEAGSMEAWLEVLLAEARAAES
jgi:hypothetical protein